MRIITFACNTTQVLTYITPDHNVSNGCIAGDLLLIESQIYGHFDPALEECMLVVPQTIRIVGYDPPAVPAYPDRPTIRIEGEMGGAGWQGAPDGTNEDVRWIHGTVSVVADGSIRWRIVSYGQST